MRTAQSVKDEIIQRFGFFPPFFEPAMETPSVLENLWQQTLSAYVENPLPALFKEKLAALIAKYCSVPYCLICHTSTLRPLGMKGAEANAESAIFVLVLTLSSTFSKSVGSHWNDGPRIQKLPVFQHHEV